MFLEGIRVIELADELGEYAGRVLAGLGADVIKVEPLAGESTRRIGPFVGDSGDPEESLHFWHYNFGKYGVTLDLDDDDACQRFRSLLAGADVLLETRGAAYMNERGLGKDDLRQDFDHLIHARITPFGDTGPWAHFKGSDLVHLALGGVMMNCGYSPSPDGEYFTPPIAPAMWQSYHIAGEMAAFGVMGALNHRVETGQGQYLSVSVHEAVSKNTETDLPNWVYARRSHMRQTCRHSSPLISGPTIAATADGRWVLPYRTYLRGYLDAFPGTRRLLSKYGLEADLDDPRYADPEIRQSEPFNVYYAALIDRLVQSFPYHHDIWQEAQDEGLPWAPLRRPEELATDEHFRSRDTFVEVEYPERRMRVPYVVGKWRSEEVPWRTGPCAPSLGEHNETFLDVDDSRIDERSATAPRASGNRPLSKRGKPFALNGVRIIDLSWLLASGGAGRFFTALGAEVIKVEHLSRVDGMRFSNGPVPPGGRVEREQATEPLMHTLGPEDYNRGGGFMEINAGKRSFSLNLKTNDGKELLADLIRAADMVIEGFSPGTMDRMGFGYERLRELNPEIIYVQQSGMGQHGTYGRMRSFGPVAQAFSGLTEMSGLPEPWPPAGIGYSYLDWFGAYNMANAMMAALYRRRVTGKGCWIDSSQVETGIYLTGSAILDHAVNGRTWQRHGNRSPNVDASPHGAYPCRGSDRWLAISCFTDEQWRALQAELEIQPDDRFATLRGRLEHQDDVDVIVAERTQKHDAYELMERCQAQGIPVGVCQSAQDRYEHDPQLRHDEWLVELYQHDNGWWPVKELPIKFEQTPAYIGGPFDRSGPSYGQDNEYVLTQILGLSEDQIDSLTARHVF